MAENPTKVVTPEFRVAFPNVFRAKRNDLSGKDEYSVVALFKKGENLDALKKAAAAALEKKFGTDKKKWPKNLKTPFRDQADRAKEDESTGKTTLPKGYEEGAVYLNLRTNQQPGLLNRNKEEILDQSEFYGGCYAMASINAYAYNQKGNAGVAFGLMHVLKTKDGEPFGVRSKATDDFEAVTVPEGELGGEGSASDLFS